jgi:glycine betaine/proline transport system ATP-binding protein
MITVRNVLKVFGTDVRAAVEQLDAGKSKEEVLAETGCTVAVREASFEVREGETFVVMGRSGSGKSTLLRCLNRLVAPTRGTVEIDGEDVTAMSKERLRELCRTRLAMVFQQFGLFPHRTVAGNVAYGLEVSGVAPEEREARVRDALDQVGLRDYADHRPDALSGGMQQRVGLARALATDPDVLLMDEPFSALDPLIRSELQDELLRLQRQTRRTVVFITHDVNEAFRLADRLAIMEGGRIVQVGTPVEILAHPANAYVRDFVAGVDRMHALHAGDVAGPASNRPASTDPAHPADLPTVDASAPLAEVVPAVLRRGPHLVRDDTGPTGIITEETLATVLSPDDGERDG